MKDNMTILIVEDNPVNMELAQVVLEMAGFNILAATTAEAGIEMAISQQPGLVLMDISLPEMDGLEALRILKAEEKTHHIPIVCLSAHAMADSREKAETAGADGYITKPIDTARFAEEVARFLKK